MSGRIQQSFIDDLLARVDIVDIIDARVPLKKTGSNYSACCPFHNEKTPSFTVSADKQFYHCFGCGAHGSAIGFLMEFDHLEFVEAIEELAERMGLEVLRESGSDQSQPKRDLSPLYELNQQVDAYFQSQLREPLAASAVAYLKQRGITGELARDFHLGFARAEWAGLRDALGQTADSLNGLKELGLVITGEGGKQYDRFRNRIVFPIRNRRGQVIGFGGRVLGDDVPKYLNSPETPLFHKGREVYGLYESLQSQTKIERLLLVEGYMDVIALHQFGLKYAVAALGTAITHEQLELLFRTSSELVMCLDGDAAGQKAAWRALKNALPLLRSGRTLRFLLLPQGEDPDSLIRAEGRDGFEQRIQRATPLSEYFFDYLAGLHDTSHMEGRAALVEEAKPLLETLPSGAYFKMMAMRLAEISNIDPDVSLPQMSRQSSSASSTRSKSAPTPLRRVITLLLHNPQLVLEIDWSDLESEVNLPGLPLLQSIIEAVQINPEIHSGALEERFRQTEHEKAVRKLMADEFLVLPPAGQLDELKGALARVQQQLQETRLNELLDRAGREPLSPEDRETLRQLSARKS